MKKSLLLLITVFATLIVGCQKEEEVEKEFEVNGIYYQIDPQNSTAMVKGCSMNRTGTIAIPEIVPHEGNIYVVTSIGEGAFKGCNSLTTINFSSSVSSIGDEAFYNCSSLAKINFPTNSQLTSIGGYAFYNCSSLTSIKIPAGVTEVNYKTFYNCSGLANITLPESITKISGDVFIGCKSLTTINMLAVTPPEAYNSSFDYKDTYWEPFIDATLYVPEGTVDIYKKINPWDDFREIKEY